ncbi:thymidine kinase [Candidatus Woesearchaeota archaeon]|nr:thymidine kinase [Candidatus Woesearchaeota archaeon]
MMQRGRLEVIAGTMFGGKSTELIRRVNRYEVTGKSSQLFKPIIDNRYSKEHVSSHDGLIKKVIAVQDYVDLAQRYNPNIPVLAVDEPQFLDGTIVDLCEEHAQRGGVAIVSLLLKDFKDRYFQFKDGKYDASEFLRRADDIVFLKAICTAQESNGAQISGIIQRFDSASEEKQICGQEATRVQRFIDGKVASSESPLVLVGQKEAYAPRCRQHYVFY